MRGNTSNGQFILDEVLLRAWLSYLREAYPDMYHWGQDREGNRYNFNSQPPGGEPSLGGPGRSPAPPR
jgi:hypothetical protein